MTKVIFLAIICLSFSCRSQMKVGFPAPISVHSAVPIPSTYDTKGTIFADNMQSNSNYTGYHYAGYWNFSDLGLTMTNSGNSANPYDNFQIYNKWNTNLENSLIEQPFTPLVDCAGIGIGIVGFLNGSLSTYIGRIIPTGANKGKLSYDVCTGTNPYITNLGISSTSFTITHGSGYKLSLKRTPDSTRVSIIDTLSGASLSVSVFNGFTSSDFRSQRQGSPGMFWQVGAVRAYNLKYISWVVKHPDMLFTGDSNLQGEYAGSESSTYTQQVASYFNGQYIVDAIASNNSSDIVAILPEIVLQQRKSVFVNIGTNDTDSATFKTNLDNIVTTLTGARIKVYLGTIFPTTSGVESLNSVVRGETGVTLIDLDSTLLNGGSTLYPAYRSVTVHLNTAGMMPFKRI